MNRGLTAYNRRRRAARIHATRQEARKAERERLPYVVVVYRRADRIAVEQTRFATIENATGYASRYADNEALGAYIE